MKFPNIQHIENDLLRRVIFCIVFIPLVTISYIQSAVVGIWEFHKEAFHLVVNDVHDVWVKGPYRQNKFIFHDFSKDDI